MAAIGEQTEPIPTSLRILNDKNPVFYFSYRKRSSAKCFLLGYGYSYFGKVVSGCFIRYFDILHVVRYNCYYNDDAVYFT